VRDFRWCPRQMLGLRTPAQSKTHEKTLSQLLPPSDSASGAKPTAVAAIFGEIPFAS